MQTGLIYKATNLINGKIYIGQTTNTLKERIKGHYKDSKRHDYKFSRALRKYSKDDWKWDIVESNIFIKDLDTAETKYIAEFNSYKNGYNSTLGGNSNRDHLYSNTIYELYKPSTGIIKGTRQELIQINEKVGKGIHNLIAGRTNYLDGFILASRKEEYDLIIGIREFYHKDYGIVVGTITEIEKTYNFRGLAKLTSGNRKREQGWVLAENKDNYNKIFNILTLEHPFHGKHTLAAKDFCTLFNLTTDDISRLKIGKYKQSKGWKLVPNT